MRPESLDGVPAEIWQHLVVGNDAWRSPMLATALRGGGADARTVVLREVDEPARSIVFFTDRRSGKVEQLALDPRACLALYDAERQLQVRLHGEAREVDDRTLLDNWWQALGGHQRLHYAPDVDVVADSLADTGKGRENFTAFRVTIDHMHCLWITPGGNSAAEFSWRENRWQGRTIRP